MARKQRADRRHLKAVFLAAMSFALADATVCAAEAPPPTFYTVIVRPHDTVSSIAMRYDLSAAEIARLNRLRDDSGLYAGEVLRIPARSRKTREAVLDEAANALIRNYAAPPKPIHPWNLEAADVSMRPLPPPVQAETEVIHRGYRWHHRASQDIVVASVRHGRFVWPLTGRVISPFGDCGDGERNDGINIATRAGTPIHAAATGTVRYAGDKIKGYGNLVLIQHDDGYMTAYAHAESLTVSEGDHVDIGQVIGYAGATGDVDRPQLHFEIRHGVRPVNPRLLLGTQPYKSAPTRRLDKMSA